jgi:hypothetical protein
MGILEDVDKIWVEPKLRITPSEYEVVKKQLLDSKDEKKDFAMRYLNRFEEPDKEYSETLFEIDPHV